MAIRIPFHAKHGPSPKGTEGERIATSAFGPPRNDMRYWRLLLLLMVQKRTPLPGCPYGFSRLGGDGPPSAFPTGRCCRQGWKNGQVAIGTDFVGFEEKPVAHWFFKIFRKCEFSNTGKLALYIDIKVFFALNLYKVSGFQWTNREICCIIITFLCRRRKR